MPVVNREIEMINVVSAGIVPEYSVVRYHVEREEPRVGYVLHGSGDNVILVIPGGDHFLNLGSHELVELLATPALTACFYIGNKEI